jgi:hypothetical protein
MNGRRERRPGVEPLESRELLVGFYEGPSLSPRHLALLGSIAGTAVVRPATAGHAETIKIGAAGRVSPVGKATVSGTLRVVGGVEQGTLALNSWASNLTLRLSGPPSQASASTSTTLPFEYSGVGFGPTTNYSYQVETGGGSLIVSIGPGSGRVPLTLTFQSDSNGFRAGPSG